MQLLIPVALVFGLIVLVLGARSGARAEDREGTGAAVVSAAAVTALSREQLRTRLAGLAKAPPPKPSMGAMCYDMAMPPQRAEYVCPACGEKSLYVEGLAQTVAWELQSCRRQFKELQKVSGDAVRLDESLFCRQCKPDEEEPALVLVVSYKEGNPHRTKGVDSNDLRLVTEFLSGETGHKDFYDAVTPLNKHAERINELLGLGADAK